MNWIKYLLEANLYLALFYGAYYLLLRRETYYQLNRAYLLSSSLLAFVIPLLQLGILKPASEAIRASAVETADAGTAAQFAVQTVQPMPAPAIVSAPAIHIDYYLWIYIIVAALLTIGFGIRIFQLIRLSRRGERTVINDFKVIEIDEDDRAFSFFNYLFISKKLAASDTVIRHEIVHIEQRHSMDIIYLELLKIICWFNPFVYLMQHSIKEIHEFIADNHISSTGQDINAYTDFLVSNAYGMSETSLTNNFFNKKLLKNRIMMLHQKRSGSLARLKYLIALPLLAGMLCISTLGFTKNYKVIDLAPGHNVTDNPVKPIKPQRKAPPAPPLPPVSKAKTVTGKGYEYEESGYLIKGKANFRVIITEKNGEQKEFFKNTATPADLKLLSNKYGYTFPSMTLHDKMPPLQPVAPKTNTSHKPAPSEPRIAPMPSKPAAKSATADNPDNADTGLPFDALYAQLAKNIIYPKEARDNRIAGTIYLTFTVSADNKAQDIKVLKGLGSGIDEATVRALKKCTTPADAKTDMTYVIPVSFNLVDRSGKPGPHLPGDQNVPTLKSNQVLLKAIIISAAIPPK